MPVPEMTAASLSPPALDRTRPSSTGRRHGRVKALRPTMAVSFRRSDRAVSCGYPPSLVGSEPVAARPAAAARCSALVRRRAAVAARSSARWSSISRTDGRSGGGGGGGDDGPWDWDGGSCSAASAASCARMRVWMLSEYDRMASSAPSAPRSWWAAPRLFRSDDASRQ